MNNTNHNSAFYSGATRYGGSSAIAKRREAARKAFFATKEGPRRSNKINNGTNMIHLYTINSQDITRQETRVPQLSASAKRFFSWIEENSFSKQQDATLTKRRKIRNRFNPMPLRAPTNAEAIAKPRELPPPPPPKPIVASPVVNPLRQPVTLPHVSPVKVYQCPPQMVEPSTPVKSPIVELSDSIHVKMDSPPVSQQQQATQNQNLTPQQAFVAPVAPISLRLKSARYRGPRSEIPALPSSARKFAKPRELPPPPPPKPIVASPVVNPLRQPFTLPHVSPIKVYQCPPQTVEPATPVKSQIVELSDGIDVEMDSRPVSQQQQATQNQNLTSQEAFVAPVAPISLRFKSATYRGPRSEIPALPSSARKFAKPRELPPPPPPKPIVASPVVNPLRQPVTLPHVSPIKVYQCPPQTVEPATPVKSQIVELSDSMDVEMDSTPVSQQQQVTQNQNLTSQPSPITTTSTPIVMMPSFTNSGFQAASNPTFQAPVAPTFSTSSFQMPSSFSPSVFTPPAMPPIAGLSTPTTNSNPFAPAASSTVRGRKILRPVRPSRRLR